jgi:hypothetical protein
MNGMTDRVWPRPCLRVFVGLAALALFGAPTAAQPPTINQPFPLGVQRGTALDLVLTGSNLAEPTGLLTDFPAKVTFPPENNNGKDNARLVVRLEVPRDALIGWHSVRLATTRGVSNLRLFCVDDLPQVMEVEGNNAPAAAQAVPVPCVVCGRADAEKNDYFKFTVQAGQRLSFEVLGRRLGSQLDPQIVLLNPRTGKQLAFADDSPGQGKDPRLTYTFPEAGEYVLELRDVRYQGGADWYYRLRVGDFPCATTPVPLAAKRGTQALVTFAGPNVEGVPPLPVVVPRELDADTMYVWPTSPATGLPGWPVALAITDLDELTESEPNDEPAKANRLAVPAGVSCRFQKKGDKDCFVFAAKKGQRYVIDVQTQELYSPTAVYLVLKDAAGAQVAASNPATDPTRIDYTAPADGDLTLVAEHLHYWGGPEETYRLTVRPYEPGFTLTAAADRLDLPQGGGALLAVQVARQDYNGAVEVAVIDPPGVSGSTTIAAGQTAALLYVAAAPDRPLAGEHLVLRGRAVVGGKAVVVRASTRSALVAALNNLPFPPRNLDDALALAVTEKAPFTVQVQPGGPEVARGVGLPVTVTVTKAAGFDEEVTVTSQLPPPAPGQQPPLPPLTIKVPKGQLQASGELKPPPNAPLVGLAVGFSAQTKAKGRDFALAVPPVALAVVPPFELQVDTGGGKLTQDGKHKLKVKAVRRGGYRGPIALEVRNLPANVTAAKAAIAENQSEAEVELTAAGNAAPGDKGDVNVLGTAAPIGNQQVASGNFALSVVRKEVVELQVDAQGGKVTADGKHKIKVKAARKNGYTGPIELEVRNLPANVTAPKVTLAEGQAEAEIELTAAAAAAVGDKADVHVVATAPAAGGAQKASANFTLSVLKKP